MYGRNGHHTESNSPLIKNNIKKKKKDHLYHFSRYLHRSVHSRAPFNHQVVLHVVSPAWRFQGSQILSRSLLGSQDPAPQKDSQEEATSAFSA